MDQIPYYKSLLLLSTVKAIRLLYSVDIVQHKLQEFNQANFSN